LETQIVRAAKTDEVARRLMAIPGLGPLSATAILAAVGDARTLKTARDFGAWLGLTPRQFSTGGKAISVGFQDLGQFAADNGDVAKLVYSEPKNSDAR
jgi:transposase